MGDGRLQQKAAKRQTPRSGTGDPALLFIAGMPGQHTITVIVPGVDDFSVTVETALGAANCLESVVGHAVD